MYIKKKKLNILQTMNLKIPSLYVHVLGKEFNFKETACTD